MKTENRNYENKIILLIEDLLKVHRQAFDKKALRIEGPNISNSVDNSDSYTSEIVINVYDASGDLIDVLEQFVYYNGKIYWPEQEMVNWFNVSLSEVLENN